MSDKENSASKKPRFRTARGWVAFACVAFALAGMAFRVGIGTPSAFGIQQISAICPLGALETMAGAKSVMLHPLLLFVLVVVLIALVGKAFCAWMCPVPWLQKFFRPRKHRAANGGVGHGVSAKSGAGHGVPASRNDPGAASVQVEPSATACIPSACAACAGAAACAKALAPVGGARDGVQLDSRHAVLVGTLASAAVFGFPVFCLICPVGLTFATIIGLWNLVQFNEPSWALIIFPIILIAEVTVLRKWCSKICPISALVSLLSNLNVTLRPRVKADVCLRSRGVDCHACVDACPEQLDPHSGRIPECSKCGKCVEACPAKAISIKLLK
ncbi:4Fe-4S binding protein [uncultured Senegalimassilia sp.]|uniref:4Fe-4S binding protein n=1 Tax=uncultured Senegalimassilia sp. TaxID=1714350 RepID=UPI0027DBD50B|nr:4Fe-4S binding protein [uncultured Senegalimassilia sp.]